MVFSRNRAGRACELFLRWILGKGRTFIETMATELFKLQQAQLAFRKLSDEKDDEAEEGILPDNDNLEDGHGDVEDGDTAAPDDPRVMDDSDGEEEEIEE